MADDTKPRLMQAVQGLMTGHSERDVLEVLANVLASNVVVVSESDAMADAMIDDLATHMKKTARVNWQHIKKQVGTRPRILPRERQ